MSILSLTPRRFDDSRGWFAETFNARRFSSLVPHLTFVQDNQSLSKRPGTIRGLHFQTPPHAQAKLVSCTQGAIFDVAVDIRNGSPTYGHYVFCELSAKNGRQLFIPAGFAHGLMTLEPDTQVVYKVSDYYAPECDAGLRWNDADIGIAWPLAVGEAALSAKDEVLPLLKDFKSPFSYDGHPMTLTEV